MRAKMKKAIARLTPNPSRTVIPIPPAKLPAASRVYTCETGRLSRLSAEFDSTHLQMRGKSIPVTRLMGALTTIETRRISRMDHKAYDSIPANSRAWIINIA